MLRRASQFLILLVVFVFLGGTVSSALSDKPVISRVKTGETGALTREYVDIYNNSENPVDITGWCLFYASATDVTKTKLACLEPPAQNIKLILSPFSYARLSSAEFNSANIGFIPDAIFSATMSATGGHIRLLNADAVEQDKLGWGTAISPEQTIIAAHPSGSVFSRKAISNLQYLQDTNNNSADFTSVILATIPASGIVEQQVLVDVCTNIDGMQTTVPDDYFLDKGSCIQDVCDNMAGLQATIPTDFESLDGENCTLIPIILESSILAITELLPNASGSDAGKEFIEIYNPNNHAVELEGYKIELGPAYSKGFVLKQQLLDPFSFVTFSDVLSKITLPNSTASLRLIAPNGATVSQVDPYNSPKDDEAWALVNNVWQFTNQPTPEAPNLVSLVEDLLNTNGADKELSPCVEGQERNPATNRCRSVASTTDNLVPCKTGQERNPETNRCRAVIDTASALVPCSQGQERNPETNRCKNISTVGEVASAKVTDIPSTAKNSNNLLIIGVLVAGVAGYAIYEWRSEIVKLFSRLRPRS